MANNRAEKVPSILVGKDSLEAHAAVEKKDKLSILNNAVGELGIATVAALKGVVDKTASLITDGVAAIKQMTGNAEGAEQLYRMSKKVSDEGNRSFNAANIALKTTTHNLKAVLGNPDADHTINQANVTMHKDYGRDGGDPMHLSSPKTPAQVKALAELDLRQTIRK